MPYSDRWDALQFNLDSQPRTAATLVFFVAFLIYFFSPVHGVSDSNYSMMLSEQLYRRGSWDLSEYFDSRPTAPGLDYQLRSVGTGLYYDYPPGSSVLSVPLVWVVNRFGITAIGYGGYSQLGEVRIERIVAAAVTAATVLVFFLTCGILLRTINALILTCCMALATPLWSTASRCVTSHTWGILLLGCAIYLLLREQVERGRANPIWMGTVLAWLYFVRPTFALSIAFITLFMLLAIGPLATRRTHWLRGALLVATGMVWLAGFVAWSNKIFGTNLPPYYQSAGALSLRTFPESLAGQLFSPGRGLWIFSPWLLAIPVGLIIRRRSMPYRKLAMLSVLVIGFHWLLISAWPMWWFGHCFGPRAFTDVMPWFGLLLVLVMAAGRDPTEINALAMPIHPAARWALAASVLLSIAIHAGPAFSFQGEMWNRLPQDIDVKPVRVWDWRDPQALAILNPRKETAGR